MGNRQQETSSWPRSTSATPPADGGLPLFAAVTFALAAAITVAAATIFFRGTRPSEHLGPPNETESLHSKETKTGAPDNTPLGAELPKTAPEITPLILAAQQRAKIWHPSAVVTSIEAIVRDARHLDSLTVEFGRAIGQPAAGAPVNADRLVIATVDDKTTSKEVVGESLRLGLADPNCPLEVAIRKLTETGVGKSGRLGVMLINSERHSRIVWLMSTSDGQTFPLDADSCALLRR